MAFKKQIFDIYSEFFLSEFNKFNQTVEEFGDFFSEYNDPNTLNSLEIQEKYELFKQICTHFVSVLNHYQLVLAAFEPYKALNFGGQFDLTVAKHQKAIEFTYNNFKDELTECIIVLNNNLNEDFNTFLVDIGYLYSPLHTTDILLSRPLSKLNDQCILLNDEDGLFNSIVDKHKLTNQIQGGHDKNSNGTPSL